LGIDVSLEHGALHRLLAIRAMQSGDSLNNFVVKALKKVTD
jgi:predicted HicB family RNase H-like nuclease